MNERISNNAPLSPPPSRTCRPREDSCSWQVTRKERRDRRMKLLRGTASACCAISPPYGSSIRPSILKQCRPSSVLIKSQNWRCWSMLQASRARDLRSIHPTQIFRSRGIESLGPLYFLLHYCPSSRRTNFHKHFGKRAGIPPPRPSITYTTVSHPPTPTSNPLACKPTPKLFPRTSKTRSHRNWPLTSRPHSFEPSYGSSLCPSHYPTISHTYQTSTTNNPQSTVELFSSLFLLPSSYSNLTFNKKTSSYRYFLIVYHLFLRLQS